MATYRKEYDAAEDSNGGVWTVYLTPDGKTQEEPICMFVTEDLADLMLASLRYADMLKLSYGEALATFDADSDVVINFDSQAVSLIAKSMSLDLSQDSAKSFLAEHREAMQLAIREAGYAWLEQQLRKHPPTD